MLSPSSRQDWRKRSSITLEKSTAVTEATRLASGIARVPAPQPKSSTLQEGSGCIRSRNRLS